MTKADLVSIIIRQTGQPKANVVATVDAFFEVVKTTLSQGGTVHVRGFGSFQLKHRAKRLARNIRQNKLIEVPAYDYPIFKPSQEFKDQVKNWEGGTNA